MARKEPREVAKVTPPRLPSPIEEMERWFDMTLRRPFPFFGPSWMPRFGVPEFEEVSPTVDIYEDGDDVIVKTEVPGMKKEDIAIKLADDTITITGEKKKEETVEKKNYYHHERSYGSFERSFRLPTDIQVDKTTASFKEGVLEIKLPKTEESKKKVRTVKIT